MLAGRTYRIGAKFKSYDSSGTFRPAMVIHQLRRIAEAWRSLAAQARFWHLAGLKAPLLIVYRRFRNRTKKSMASGFIIASSVQPIGILRTSTSIFLCVRV